MEIAIVEDKSVPTPAIVDQDESNALIRMALDKNLDADKLDKLIALKNREVDRAARVEFDKNFAKLQAKLPIIKKTKEAKNRSDKTMYKYAPLEALQAVTGPIIARMGFSYSWREEAIEGGKRVIMVITGYGATKETYFDVPMIQGTDIQNAIQVAGAMSTYGKRYTYIAGFGLTVEGEDEDGTFDADKYNDQIARLTACTTMEQLAKVFKEIWTSGLDLEGKKIITATKNSKKKELAGGTENRRMEAGAARESDSLASC